MSIETVTVQSAFGHSIGMLGLCAAVGSVGKKPR
jgi:hypothetical protein